MRIRQSFYYLQTNSQENAPDSRLLTDLSTVCTEIGTTYAFLPAHFRQFLGEFHQQ